MNIILNLTQFIYCSAYSSLSLLGNIVFATEGIVHTISLEDATSIIKNIGVFKKRLKVRTDFTRH